MMPTTLSSSSARQASHLAASTSRRCCAAVPRIGRRPAVAARASAPQQTPPPPQTRRPGPGPRSPPGPPLPPGTIMGPDGTPLKVVKVEDTAADAWAAVAAVDRGEGDDDGAAASTSAALALAAGDLAALLAFAAVGRASHGEPLDPASLLATAGPFLAAWFPVAFALGGYGRAAAGREGGEASAAALAAVKVWAAAVPLGIVLRSLVRGYAPPTVFVGVTMGVTLFVMVGWRAAFGAVSGGGGDGDGASSSSPPQTPQQRLAARKDRKGGPMELLQVIMSLTKRW